MFYTNPIFYVIIICAFLIVFFLIKILRKPDSYYIKQELKKLSTEYIIKQNVQIRYNDDTYIIDTLIISNYGIFVIKNFNYKGYIDGNEFDKTWLVSGNFVNSPVLELEKQVDALKNVLCITDSRRFIPIVCLTNKKSYLRIRTNKSVIIPISKLSKTIVQNREVTLNDLEEIFKNLKQGEVIIKKGKKSSVPINENICPLCGRMLVPKNGPHGEFLGCLNYPACKYTRKM